LADCGNCAGSGPLSYSETGWGKIGVSKWGSSMKPLSQFMIGTTAAALLLAGTSLSAQTVKESIKQAGRDTKQAATTTADTTKKTAKKATSKASDTVEKGAKKVKDKTY